MTYSHRIRRRWLRSLAFGLTLAAIAVPATAQAMPAGGGPYPAQRGTDQTTGFIRDSSQTAVELAAAPVTGFIRDSSQTAIELAPVPETVATPVSPQAADEPTGDWRSISIGLAAALAALMAAMVRVGVARRQRKPPQTA